MIAKNAGWSPFRSPGMAIEVLSLASAIEEVLRVLVEERRDEVAVLLASAARP